MGSEVDAEIMEQEKLTEPTQRLPGDSPICIDSSDNSLSAGQLAEWPALGSNSLGSEWELCSEASSLASSWALLDEVDNVGDAEVAALALPERFSFADVLQRGMARAGVQSSAVAPTRPTSAQVRVRAVPKEDDEVDAAHMEYPCEKDGRGGRWMRMQKGTHSVKQRKRVDSAICRRNNQRLGRAPVR